MKRLTSPGAGAPPSPQGEGTATSMRDKARELRSTETEAENRLWYYLRAGRFMGLKFKRQEPIGHYIADFLCPEHKLIVELDGSQHLNEVNYDAQRSFWLNQQGFTVLRFWNDDVFLRTQQVLEQIHLATRSAVPSPQGEGGPSGPGEGKSLAHVHTLATRPRKP
ncbi:endonuclease domain-containing protein [Uliginosibacterium sediminicola]|uniref:Endonuclease domain-containing protein n=1 Tax=Uliginosibacterium sediminicola TaxID=2024550 RepID=A0ABU9YYZ5_9RHOO